MSGISKNGGVKFPSPLQPKEVKEKKGYGLAYAKAIFSQWGGSGDGSSLFNKRNKVFDSNRKYANGTQETTIYRKLLDSDDPNGQSGSWLNLDFTPVPILPKFVRIVTNKILSYAPYPNLEAVDPLSSSEKDAERRRVEMLSRNKEALRGIKEKLGVDIGDVENIPATPEEAEIFIDNNVKSSSEIAAQIATELTLKWNDFSDVVYRRCVNDISILGMSVVKRNNDPSYGITTEYVDPSTFIHSYTEDPGFNDLVYGGHVKRIPLYELRRLAGDELTEEDLKVISGKVSGKYGNNAASLGQSGYDSFMKTNMYSYDEYMVEVMDFEFLSVDEMFYEEKDNRFGNTGFYFKGSTYKEPGESEFRREVTKVNNATIYGGMFILGTEHVIGYSQKTNVPKNIHDLSKATLSYSVVATNLEDMMPKSLVDGCKGFADMLQLTHLKIQQSIAKAKPDGLVIDIDALENVDLGKGGEMSPIDLHDVYEKTGVYYYRGVNPDGGHQNPPIREIGNSIRNINELVGIYNQYLRMIRDATGINEVVDGTSPKGEALVGVRQQAIEASNNAIYDITNSAMLLYKKVCTDIVKCLQVLDSSSVIFEAYSRAIGDSNMEVLNSFKDLPMYNFGVFVSKEMEDSEKQYLEQNIQISLSQKELDLEDAMAIRQLKDVNQAERLLIVRRKKRQALNQQQAQQNSQMQAQIQTQVSQATAQAKQQEMQMEAQLTMQRMQMQAQLDAQLDAARHQQRKEIEIIKAQATLGFKTDDQEFKEKLEVLKEDRKDTRLGKQTVDQSKLISQRKGDRGELDAAADAAASVDESVIDSITNNIV
tara:strand:- start:1586 stop:4048 length:2463 start_codon:yes stop_codon:yes gene_type:complete